MLYLKPASLPRLALSVAVLAGALCAAPVRGGDWPQILGPNRNGVAEGETLAAKWPEGGPALRWKYKLGSGYSGPVVSGKRVVVFHRTGGVERVEALDVDTGRSLWKADFEATYRDGINPDTGPRSVPVIHNDRVIVYGAAGDLHCVSLTNGMKIWSRSTLADFDGDEGYFGAGSTPLVVGKVVLVNVGGRDDAGLVGFSLADGSTLWKGTAERASYSSPTYAEIDGRPHAIFVTRLSAISVDPATGRVQFQFPFGKRGPTVNAATPLVFDGNKLFLSASYGIGAVLAEIEKSGVRKLWSSDDVMSSQYTTCVYRDGYLYGVDGREDIPPAVLKCVEAKTGKVKWSVGDFGIAHVILVGDKLLIVKNDGRLLVAAASPDGYRELAGAKVFDRDAGLVVRALPALADGRLYVRSSHTDGSGGELRCLTVGPAK